MIVNRNVTLLFIDYTTEYMQVVKAMLEQGKRLLDEKIYLVHSIAAGLDLLRNQDAIEMIVLHTKPDMTAAKKALTKLRRASLAEIMVIASFDDEDDISELYQYGMNILIEPKYRPQMAVAYFESFIDRRRLIPSISCMKEIVHIKDNAKMQYGDLIIDLASHSITRSGTEVFLSAMEYKLLLFFSKHANQLLTPDQIYSQLKINQ